MKKINGVTASGFAWVVEDAPCVRCGKSLRRRRYKLSHGSSRINLCSVCARALYVPASAIILPRKLDLPARPCCVECGCEKRSRSCLGICGACLKIRDRDRSDPCRVLVRAGGVVGFAFMQAIAAWFVQTPRPGPLPTIARAEVLKSAVCMIRNGATIVEAARSTGFAVKTVSKAVRRS